ncbi:MAG: protein-ADP-ribose hydrolase [Lachnospiraceae bacterium]|nr:protein-ADP-ribose hydrolase [Lachnospiraceae bacterium]
MTHDEQRKYLIQELLDENVPYKDVAIPDDVQQQKLLLRSLMNVRLPKPISQEFRKVQDEYLCYERDVAGVVDAESLPVVPSSPKLVLWQGDITVLKCDAIVNAANSQMCGCFRSLHSCIDNIVHTKAGIELRLKCNDIMQKQGHEEPTGRAKITPAYNLPSQYVLHTVGPIIETGHPSVKQKEQLASCYRSCLELAAASGCKSIAFCCISTGVFMFPNQLAAEIAVQTVKDFLAEDTRIERVIFNVFKDLDKGIYEELLGVN